MTKQRTVFSLDGYIVFVLLLGLQIGLLYEVFATISEGGATFKLVVVSAAASIVALSLKASYRGSVTSTVPSGRRSSSSSSSCGASEVETSWGIPSSSTVVSLRTARPATMCRPCCPIMWCSSTCRATT